MKKKLLFVILIPLLFSFSFCKKIEKKEQKISEEEKSDIIMDDFPSAESLVRDDNRYFIFEDWHPLIQSQEIQKIKKLVKAEDIIHYEDSLYDDDFSKEFSLTDKQGNNYCLFHNIRKLPTINTQEYEIYKYWKEDFFWAFKEIEGFSVLWNFYNGSILIFGTDSPDYITSRGIKVGDSVDKIIQSYAKDCEISEYNYEKKMFEVVSKHNAPFMALYKSDDCISINSGNAKSEEMRTLLFFIKNNLVEKIVITGVE